MNKFTHINPAPYDRTLRGEDAVESALKHALQTFDEPPVVFRSIIFKTPDDEVASIEIDFLVITAAKVFVIEVKDMNARVYHEDGSSDLILCSEQGLSEFPNPLGQNIRKINFLKAKYPLIHFESFAVMASINHSIDQKVPANILHINDIAYHLRRKNSDFRRRFKKIGKKPNGGYIAPLDGKSVQEVSALLLALSDRNLDAMDNHISRCTTFRLAKVANTGSDLAGLATKALHESVARARRAGMTDSEIVDALSAIPDFND